MTITEGKPLPYPLPEEAWVLKTLQDEFYRFELGEGISYIKSADRATKYDTLESAVREASAIACEFRYTYPVKVELSEAGNRWEPLSKEDHDTIYLRYRLPEKRYDPWLLSDAYEMVRLIPGKKEWREV